ncbi:hypothetical protein ADIWIN_0483 [Winogradskyella psychrotolerans RS-3]|uniref:Uncharacterized protein n=1 Tax=Winogradskyella psychrotolerans RS-3 TaxID=641526 RepID=S7VY65_9FLAO|nr:hypothetical protein ADIWIN_0483 [Winogradskyella psychrotolerans RS-3]
MGLSIESFSVSPSIKDFTDVFIDKLEIFEAFVSPQLDKIKLKDKRMKYLEICIMSV